MNITARGLLLHLRALAVPAEAVQRGLPAHRLDLPEVCLGVRVNNPQLSIRCYS